VSEYQDYEFAAVDRPLDARVTRSQPLSRRPSNPRSRASWPPLATCAGLPERTSLRLSRIIAARWWGAVQHRPAGVRTQPDQAGATGEQLGKRAADIWRVQAELGELVGGDPVQLEAVVRPRAVIPSRARDCSTRRA
jgi:hypothetical protein